MLSAFLLLEDSFIFRDSWGDMRHSVQACIAWLHIATATNLFDVVLLLMGDHSFYCFLSKFKRKTKTIVRCQRPWSTALTQPIPKQFVQKKICQAALHLHLTKFPVCHIPFVSIAYLTKKGPWGVTEITMWNISDKIVIITLSWERQISASLTWYCTWLQRGESFPRKMALCQQQQQWKTGKHTYMPMAAEQPSTISRQL